MNFQMFNLPYVLVLHPMMILYNRLRFPEDLPSLFMDRHHYHRLHLSVCSHKSYPILHTVVGH